MSKKERQQLDDKDLDQVNGGTNLFEEFLKLFKKKDKGDQNGDDSIGKDDYHYDPKKDK